MARCLAFTAWPGPAALVADVDVLMSGLLPLISGTDVRKDRAALLVQHLYPPFEIWPGTLARTYAAGHGILLSSVLPGGQGDGAARRAMDAAHRPRAGHRQRA